MRLIRFRKQSVPFVNLSVILLMSRWWSSLNSKKDSFDEVNELVTKRKTSEILKDLYDIGIIGNYGSTSRFMFKGDTDIDPIMPITIHYPLINFFQASITYH